MLESSRANDEPATFEVGAGDVVGNNLYQAFDEAVRGLAVGDKVRIKVSPLSPTLAPLARGGWGRLGQGGRGLGMREG